MSIIETLKAAKFELDGISKEITDLSTKKSESIFDISDSMAASCGKRSNNCAKCCDKVK